MASKQTHKYWDRIKPISHWYLFLAFVICLSISVLALRQNNLNMVRLRDAVYQADKQQGDTETALRNLREYVYAHMNTDLSSGNNAIKPPIQLKYTYERLTKDEQARVAAINSKIYNDAQHHCEKLYPASFSGGPRVPCIQAYVTSHGASVQTIPPALYEFDFVTPRWSPDLAGWSLVLAAAFLMLFILRFGLERWAKSQLD